MRIEAYNQVQQLYQTKKVNKVRQTGSATYTDQLQFSNFGKEIRAAQAALCGVPDVREELIAPIKAQVQNGTYKVDTASFADKLMEKVSAMDSFNEEMR
ncbi:MAG: flagellar biosynthesis anti-sigma factor FlgM [Lachnospiraceae bacterium]|jgi:negative regulator of flagellin synthesis FlgM|nr:flagellar biosynthesis anti-sigma factor FlgM [Lachnospiraceae bacterium]